ncbi:hypothetical protein HII31_11043 [Pseudocercospora fuligena]|uniref:Uncharacterized protein n=1 Tax=Pseudocercospora fuligena TaxID=685502 RepID=A0A8H6R9T6_9PEZI|nr:hypothetical protein HII31_11043 [Pseudocercospora fuligena]
MSNRIPVIDSDEEIPYCIWHPQTASEETYRQLVKRYPAMVYQVGRACAVAGYDKLYGELEILPEVHIAEEARECGNVVIYNRIMSSKIKCKIMNDYDRSIDDADPPMGFLNGDTAVLRMLDIKQEFKKADVPEYDSDGEEKFELFPSEGYDEKTFNITEDMNIDTYRSETSGRTVTDEMLKELLTGPLPADLPTLDKDLLIKMAAYYGDTDRYVRLRRPKMLYGEYDCCVRGIYHNTLFAVWWSKQDMTYKCGISNAVEARFIMNNVLSHVHSGESGRPYIIYYPTLATECTYRELARLKPNMWPQIARACIIAEYKDLFDEIVCKIVPDDGLLAEAGTKGDTHYKQALEARVAEVGKDKIHWLYPWKKITHANLQKSKAWWLRECPLACAGPTSEYDGWNYNQFAEADEIELLTCLPDEWQRPEEEDCVARLDYEDWPPKDSLGASKALKKV